MSRPIALMVGLGAVAFFTIFANSIPQVQKHFDEGVVVEAGISQEEMAVLGEQTFNGNGGCTVCHRIGSIGARAPDLAGIGSRAAEAFLLVPGVLFVFIFAVIVYLGPSARKVPLPRYPRLSRFLSAALGENVHLTFSPTRLFIVSSDAELFLVNAVLMALIAFMLGRAGWDLPPGAARSRESQAGSPENLGTERSRPLEDVAFNDRWRTTSSSPHQRVGGFSNIAVGGFWVDKHNPQQGVCLVEQRHSDEGLMSKKAASRVGLAAPGALGSGILCRRQSGKNRLPSF